MKKIRKIFSLVLIVTLLFNMGISSFATYGISSWIDDAEDWIDTAVNDTEKWVEGASKDTPKWLNTASKDTLKWLEGAVEDVEGFYKDVSKGIKNYRKPQKPNINKKYPNLASVSNESTQYKYINIFSSDMGEYTDTYNVKKRMLSKVAQDNMIKDLRAIGLSKYWSKFAVDKVSGTAEGTSIGDVVESIIPFDFVLNGSVAEVIDDGVAKFGFDDVNLEETIQPENGVDSLTFTYKVENLNALSGPAYVKFYGVKSVGFRDNISGEFVSGGKTYKAKIFMENGVVGFIAKVDELSNLSFNFKNDFEPAENIPFEIADGLQNTINDLSPLGDPISNKARDDIALFLGDKSIVYEKTTTDSNGKKKKSKTELPSVNDLYANGDVDVIVSKTIYQIPLVGDIIGLIFKSTGNDAVLENIIRDIVDQKEVNSFIKIENPQLLISQNAVNKVKLSSSDYNAMIDGAEFEYKKYYGTNEIEILKPQNGPQMLPILKDISENRNYAGQLFMISDSTGEPIKVNLESRYELTYSAEPKDHDHGNAGLIFGVQSVSLGNDQYLGHFVGIKKAKNEVTYGTANYNWNSKWTKEFLNVSNLHKLIVDVKKENNIFKAYVNIDGLDYGSFDLEDIYLDGFVGVRTWNANVKVYDLSVFSNVVSIVEDDEILDTQDSDTINTQNDAINDVQNDGIIVESVTLELDDASSWAIDELTRASSNKLVAKRVSSGMKEEITRAEFAALTVKLYEAMTKELSTPLSEGTFKDTEDLDAKKAANLNIIKGSDGMFRPDDKVTRQEMAIMYYRALDQVYRFYGKEIPLTDGILTIEDKDDVATWASDYVDFVFENGIITGSENKFNPVGNAPREQAIVVLNRVFEKYIGDVLK